MNRKALEGGAVGQEPETQEEAPLDPPGGATDLVEVVAPAVAAAALALPSPPPEAPVPEIVRRAGERATYRFVEFFTAAVRNPNTRRAYARAVVQFLEGCDRLGVELEDIHPLLVAAYIEELGRRVSAPTVKQHLAALRMFFDFLVSGRILQMNPASSVRGPKHVVRKGKTPVLFDDDLRTLLDSIHVDHVVGLRDRAMISVMVLSFARVGAVVGMKVRDYYSQGRRAWLNLHEKGGRYLRVPAHHRAAQALDEYLEAAGIRERRESPLFLSSRGLSRQLTERGMGVRDIAAMVKRRCKEAGLPPEISCHSFRAAGITNYLENGGSLEIAARIAGHASTRTTQIYDRRSEEIELGEIERIRF